MGVAFSESGREPEGGSQAVYAFHPDRSSHALGQFLGDRQSQAGTPVTPGRGGVGLLEGLEQAAFLFRRKPDSRILHGEIQEDVRIAFLVQPHGDGNLSPLGELDRVVGIIYEDLPQVQGIPDQEVRHVFVHIDHEFQALGAGLFAGEVDDILQYLVQFEVDAFDVELSGFDLG